MGFQLKYLHNEQALSGKTEDIIQYYETVKLMCENMQEKRGMLNQRVEQNGMIHFDMLSTKMKTT